MLVSLLFFSNVLAARSVVEGLLAIGILLLSAWLSLCLVKCSSAQVEFLIAWHVLGCDVPQKHMPDCNVHDTKWHSVLILGIEILSNTS